MHKTASWLIGQIIGDNSSLTDPQQIAEIAKHPENPAYLSEAMKSQKALKAVETYKRLRAWHGSMPSEQIREVMTTADFPLYFGDAIKRIVDDAYAEQPSFWTDYTRPYTANDFRPIKKFRFTELDDLQLSLEQENAEETNTEESAIELKVRRYDRKFSVSIETFINDDLDAIKNVPEKMGRSAKRTKAKYASGLYFNATSQAYLIGLGPVYAGTGRLTRPNLALAVNQMTQRTDVKGNPIEITQVYLVIPSLLEVGQQTILRDVLEYGGPNSNVLGGFIAGVRRDPYMTPGPGPADVPWYLIAYPNEIPSVPMLTLDGYPDFAVYRKMADAEVVVGSVPAPFALYGFSNGTIQFRVESVWGAYESATQGGIADPTGIYYSSGTTP